MYVCMCNGHRDSDIKAVASQGVRCARAAYMALGGEAKCGQCLDFAQQIVDEACNANGGGNSAAA